MDLVFITGNQHKADFLSQQLGHPVTHQKLDLDELQSLDLHTVVEHKVRQAYELVNKPVVVEDVSLTFEAMGRLPGTFIKWFLEEIGCEGLSSLARSLPRPQAYAKVCYGFYEGKKLQFFDGEMYGQIADKPSGTGGFGFDPIFINAGYKTTRAEMSQDDYIKTSYRSEAVVKLKNYLDSLV